RNVVNPKKDDTGKAFQDPGRHCTETATTGWEPGCKHGKDPVPCLVIDPFSGAGTVGVVCKQLGRDFAGSELNPEYCEMARKRVQDTQELTPLGRLARLAAIREPRKAIRVG